ncbi:C25 family cysteine peptidase [Nannocystis pusilla]|uniref:C25 family cysteine peptidase n=1 Tax=Nannocystis pusilla TaxID=889268 RepID=UPI003DA4698A
MVLAACSPTASDGVTDGLGTTRGSTTDDVVDATTSTSDTTAVPTGGESTTGEVGPPPVDYVIIAADPLADAAAGIGEYRSAGGHTVALVRMSEILGDGGEPVEAIRERLRGYHAVRDPDRPMFVLLVGDAEPGGPVDADTVPLGEVVQVLEAAPPMTIPTDNLYADLDDDDITDLAVGRIPARDPAAVTAALDKIVRHEQVRSVGPHNRRINMFASALGQGALVDSLVEKLVHTAVDEIPYDFDITMTYGLQSSPYVYVPEQFSDKVVERFMEGSLMVTYIGHGSATSFPPLEWNHQLYPLLEVDALADLSILGRSPIVTLIACAMGSFAGPGDSVGASLLAAPNGPVAVLSSTELSYVYPNTIFIRELGLVMTAERPATVGEAFLRAKQRVMTQVDGFRAQIDNAFGLSLSDADMDALRRSHLHLYTLFGDPALAIGYPAPATVSVAPATVAPGGSVAVDILATSLGDGAAHVTLETARSKILGELVPVPPDDDPQRDAVIAANYEVANDKVVVGTEAALVGGAAQADLAVPAELPLGRYHIKVRADDGNAEAIGAVELIVDD